MILNYIFIVAFKTWGKNDDNFQEIEQNIFKKSNQKYTYEPLPINDLVKKLKE